MQLHYFLCIGKPQSTEHYFGHYPHDGTRIVNVKPEGVCSVNIEIHIRRNRVTFLEYTKGSNGNAKGIAALVEGMKVKEVIRRLEGIQCGKRPTSCPDQLARALKMIYGKKE